MSWASVGMGGERRWNRLGSQNTSGLEWRATNCQKLYKKDRELHMVWDSLPWKEGDELCRLCPFKKCSGYSTVAGLWIDSMRDIARRPMRLTRSEVQKSRKLHILNKKTEDVHFHPCAICCGYKLKYRGEAHLSALSHSSDYGVTYGYDALSFMDGYMGYNQIRMEPAY